MSLGGVAKAIKASVGKVDILNFDACLMSSVEVGYELKDAADKSKKAEKRKPQHYL